MVYVLLLMYGPQHTAGTLPCCTPSPPWGDEGVQRRGEADVAPAPEVVVEALQVPRLDSQIQLQGGEGGAGRRERGVRHCR